MPKTIKELVDEFDSIELTDETRATAVHLSNVANTFVAVLVKEVPSLDDLFVVMALIHRKLLVLMPVHPEAVDHAGMLAFHNELVLDGIAYVNELEARKKKEH